MTLTKAGKHFATVTLGVAGGANSGNITLRNQHGNNVSIAQTTNIQSPSGTTMANAIVIGETLLTASGDTEPYNIDNSLQYWFTNNFNPDGGTLVQGDDSSTITLTWTNTGSSTATWNYWGILAGTNGSNGDYYFLTSYYQLSTPITIEPNETKTIVLVIDMSNLC